MTAAAPVIHCSDLRKVYAEGTAAEVVALRGVSFDIAHGEFVAIIGPSGSGKSTLMNLIGCLDSPSAGRYLCDGVDVAELDAAGRARLRLEKIGFVFQGFHLLSRMSALDNVMLPLTYAGVPPQLRRDRAQHALAEVGLAARGKHRPSELSGGQQQRVAIARALANRPRILLADEPTGALDSKTTVEIMHLMQDLNRQGITVVVITHENEVAEYAKRQIHFRDGKIEIDTAHPELKRASGGL